MSEACMKTAEPINVKVYDNVGTMEVDCRVQYYDVITNPRWRTVAKSTKMFMSAYLSEKWFDYDDRDTNKMIWSKFEYF